MTQGKIEETGRRGRRRKNLLDDIKEKRGCWKLKEEAIDRPLRENSVWERLWTCRKLGCRMDEFLIG